MILIYIRQLTSAEDSFASYRPVWPFKYYDGQIFQYFFLALLTLNKLWNLAIRKWAVTKLKDIQSAKTFKAVSGTQEIKWECEISKVSYF